MMPPDYAILDENNEDVVEMFKIPEEDKDMLRATFFAVKNTLESTGHEIERCDFYPISEQVIIETKDNFNIVIQMSLGIPIVYRQKE